jgi:hypothetical protein
MQHFQLLMFDLKKSWACNDELYALAVKQLPKAAAAH